MTSLDLLRPLFRYQAWANDDLLGKLDGLDAVRQAQELHSAIRLINHAYVVGRIFAAHLTGAQHGYKSSNTEVTPTLSELRANITVSDKWFLDYLDRVAPEALSQRIAFRFTDGDQGAMSRQEMLMHVATHGGYHRGEVGRILAQLSIMPPWDTFAVFLHQSDPTRRHSV
jgi:uncharacterized damage-inducible protein DinB